LLCLHWSVNLCWCFHNNNNNNNRLKPTHKACTYTRTLYICIYGLTDVIIIPLTNTLTLGLLQLCLSFLLQGEEEERSPGQKYNIHVYTYTTTYTTIGTELNHRNRRLYTGTCTLYSVTIRTDH